ncbi:hypothetical protein GCM10022243_01610 [Saccharothrix violaceirubra]|uniref:Subtilisin inhibitor domain-containing protein n=1 Tax=Saccharothrix violaceirubra TaxID=413306 RepID=A0A7W7T3K9_9PSEU|nr:SSI family serine proteinase inhibitor [Saccharothrix violaceirubra]MBB4965918.1 hypothetical protein [Saccharothrix violaceirubra]
MSIRSTVVACVTVTACVVLAVPAQAAGVRIGSPTPKAVGPAKYTLMLSGADHTWSRAIKLNCPTDVDGHLHPFGDQACADLASVDGDPGRMHRAQVKCTPEYGRLTASLSGVHAGRTVKWSRTFRDECALYGATNTVFRF